jgi:hypothetical protein
MKYRFFWTICLFLMLSAGSAFAQVGGAGSALSGIRTPLFLGAALGFGSGTGVGASQGLGLRQIEPMFGVWYPGIGFLRVGYGFYDYQEESDDEKYEIDHSNFDVELGVHALSMFYIAGSYSRVKELSDLGDIAWSEWGAGFGSLLNIFATTMLFAEVSYRWVLEHYDPFMGKEVSGTRLQFNLGFAAYVF